MTTADPKQAVPLGDVPDYLPRRRRGRKISYATVYRWVASGRLPSFKLGGLLYVPLDALERFARGEALPPSPPPAAEPGHDRATRRLREKGLAPSA